MKRFFKYLGRTILAILGLLLLIVFLLYLPPVQDFLLRKAERYAASHYDLEVRIGHFRLGFPFDLVLDDVYAGKTAGDTLVAAEAIRLRVNIDRIFRKELGIEQLGLRQVKFGLAGDTTGMQLKVAVGNLGVQEGRIDLERKKLIVAEISLEEGDVFLKSGAGTVEDTVQSNPLDWGIEVRQIKIRDVGYRMYTEGLPYLGAGIKDGSLTGGKVLLGEQSVEIDAVAVGGAWCDMQMGTEQSSGTPVTEPSGSQPWLIRAGRLQLENSAFSMKTADAGQTDLVLSGIAVQIDSVYNRGTVVRGNLVDLRAVQQNGIQLQQMQAQVDLDSARTALRGAFIRTAHSKIELTARADTSMNNLMKRVPLIVQLNARVGLADLTPFYDGIPQDLKHSQVDLNTTFSIDENRVRFDRLDAGMTGKFRLTGKGQLQSYRDLKKISGVIDLRAEMPDATFANVFLKEGIVKIPADVSWSANLKANQGALEALVRLCSDAGCMTLDGSYDLNRETYNGELTLSRFPLDRFLTVDSLGSASANFRLEGRYFSWPQAKTSVNAGIRQLFYKEHEYKDITLQATLDKTHLRGTMVSKDPDAPLDLVFRGDSLQQQYQVGLGGYIGKVDLQALHLMQEPLTMGLKVDLQGFIGEHSAYALKARFDSLSMADSRKTYTLGSLDIDMASDLKKTTLDVKTGDLQLTFRADTSLAGFGESAGKIAGIVGKQIAGKDIGMEQIKAELPVFSMHLKGDQNNAIAKFLKARNMGFRRLSLDIVSRQRSGIRMGITATAPYFGTVRLDSVQMGIWQTGKSLVYALGAGSSDQAWKGLFNINLTGKMQGNQFRIELKQKDARQRVGFDMGINLVMLDSAFTVSFFPMTPILGYSRWIVNADNKVTVYKDWKIDANLRMAYQNKLVSLQSLPDEGERTDRLQVEITGIDLKKLTEISPFLPDLSGILHTDLLLYTDRKTFGAEGNIGVNNLFYEEQRMGTLDLDLQYAGKDHLTDHAVDFELKIDSIRRAVVQGTFATSETNREVMLDVDIPSLPLYMVNAFVPKDLMKLEGELTGALQFRGTVDRPDLNGGLGFRNGKADVVMLGTTFGLDTTRLIVDNGKILFRQYRFIAPNKSDMVLNGAITLTPFDRMNMDISVKAGNFEVVNVKKNPTSLIYGKAYINLDSRLAGAFSNLSVSGNINLLNRTNITYTLRSSGPELVDRSADLVRFVSFRDTTLNERDDLTNRVNTSSFALKMLIEIGDQVTVNVELSDDGSNNIVIQGGGNLVLAMSPENGLTLSGKYILSGGTVVYNIPIAGKKEFNIRSGSYVEWTGNVMNPMLSISASEQVKATVVDGEQNRLVTFEAIIRIQNTLTRPDISFDLSAPNDMVVQNQLATFSQEERTRQALNLLIYNTYTAPGAAKSGSGGSMANNALYSLVENELNKYTRKTGFTFGVDSYNTDENTTRTDYTYQFSKQFFNDRIRVKIGGRISTDNNENQSNNIEDNLVDDISIEYVITKKRNLFLKVFRHSNYESVLDGEVTQTGVGIVWRKNFRKFKDLFKNNRKSERETKTENQK